jgi:hypothetical protein
LINVALTGRPELTHPLKGSTDTLLASDHDLSSGWVAMVVLPLDVRGPKTSRVASFGSPGDGLSVDKVDDLSEAAGGLCG